MLPSSTRWRSPSRLPRRGPASTRSQDSSRAGGRASRSRPPGRSTTSATSSRTDGRELSGAADRSRPCESRRAEDGRWLRTNDDPGSFTVPRGALWAASAERVLLHLAVLGQWKFIEELDVSRNREVRQP